MRDGPARAASPDSPRAALAGRSILLTGATGFVGKAVLAKLLRDVPGLERIYVLVRPRADRGTSAAQRVVTEVLDSGPFAALRADAARTSRIEPVEGDLDAPDLGLAPAQRRALCERISAVIHCAAVVEFDGCSQASTRINALAPVRLLELARECRQRCALIHLSTAYVHGFRTGLGKEEPLVPDRSLASELRGAAAPPFSLDTELQRGLDGERDARGEPLEEADARRQAVQRARNHGWTDTYTFTKALGEQLLVRERADVPLGIVRPSVVSSSLIDPCPGWLEGLKVMDPLIFAYARGQLGWFVGEAQRCLDVVPVDYVVNATIAAIPAALQGGGIEVFQVATGATNPLSLGTLAETIVRHFERRPMDGATPQGALRLLPRSRVRLRIQRDRLLCRGVAAGARLLPGTARLRDQMRRNLRGLDRVDYYAELYWPYVTYACRFDASRTEGLLGSLPDSDRPLFDFDARRIDWPQYFDEIHIPGLRRFVLGEE